MIDRFGEKLRVLRLSRNLNQEEVASKLGYKSHTVISELESGKKKPTAAFVLKASMLLDVTTDALLLDDMEIDDFL